MSKPAWFRTAKTVLPLPVRSFLNRQLASAGYLPPAVPIEKYGADLYREIFPADSLEKRRFYNIGAGEWRLPFWTNVDHASDWYKREQPFIDIDWDIASLTPLRIKNGTAELVYTSHTIEHLRDEHVAHILRESHRILKPGGGIRITCPNIELYWHAYQRRDRFFNYHLGHAQPFGSDAFPSYGPKDMSLFLLNECMTQLKNSDSGNCRYTDPAELDRIFSERGLVGSMEFFSRQIDFSIQQREVGNHVNWWTHDKLRAFLNAAGFREVIISGAGQSVFPVMRDTRYFDTTIPTCSLFVEAIKH